MIPLFIVPPIFSIRCYWFILVIVIFRGAFSIVKLAINKKTGEKVAVKIIDKTQASAEADEKRLKTEVAILKQVKHPNIVCLKDLFETPQTLYLVMELYVN